MVLCNILVCWVPTDCPEFFCVSLQLRLEQGVQNRDLPCAINSPEILSMRCACNMAPAGDNYAGLVQSAALENSGKAGDLKRGIGQGNLQKQCSRNDVSLVRRPALLRVQAWVQDCLEHECHEMQNRLQDRGGRGGKVCDRRPKNRVECRQQEVQVITNNGFVELEEQLGVSKRTKEGSLQLKLSSKWQGNEVLKDEEGRLLQTRQEEGDAPPTLAQASSLVEIASHLASETGTLTHASQFSTEHLKDHVTCLLIMGRVFLLSHKSLMIW